MYDYYQVKTTIRNQWVGITDAPRTTVLSIYGKKSERVGLGGLVFNDQTGLQVELEVRHLIPILFL